MRHRAYLENLGYEVAFGPDVAPVSFYPPLRVADLSAVGGFSFGAEDIEATKCENKKILNALWSLCPLWQRSF
ncbi:MAG: hypothetical protein NTX52_06725 [Planctomycetota bacterium]|nr:hypothetical protein [Planctomycetota bacterium]